MAPSAQVPAQSRQYLGLRGPLEIDQDVAAEDHVEISVEWICFVHEIELRERNLGSQSRNDAEFAATLVARHHDITPSQFLWDGIDHRFRKAARDSLVEDFGTDICGKDGIVEITNGAAEFLQYHGNGVGLRTRRAGRAPHLYLALPRGRERRQDVILDEFEVFRFAVEVG